MIMLAVVVVCITVAIIPLVRLYKGNNKEDVMTINGIDYRQRSRGPYCSRCGGKTVPIRSGWYDPDTGIEAMDYYCPVKDCKHGFHGNVETIRRFGEPMTLICRDCNTKEVVDPLIGTH